ncbi:MAG: hypothetical protein JEY96_01530 [Bacteroidales bacterium]|nr:hypothetical protein [Bacteroidales bacterium]
MIQSNDIRSPKVAGTDIGVMTYEVKGAALTMEEERLEMLKSSKTFLNLRDNHTFEVQGYRILPYGKEHNNFPIELREIVKDNRLMPELLEKQIKLLHGKTPFLYKEKIEGKDIIRQPIDAPKIKAWLESWKQNGLKHDYRTYLLNVIRDFYWVEGIFSKYVYNKSRRTNGKLPVRGLEHTPVKRARFATLNKDYSYLPEEDEFNKFLVGDWLYPQGKTFKIYNRLDESKPFAHSVAMNYVCNSSFGEDLYSYPVWYYGLKEWLIGSNLNPKYINSYFKNSLNSQIHVLIPYSWVEKKRQILMDICKHNRELKEASKALVTEYLGVKEIGTEFRETMVNELINNELKKITELMSGEGKNQGKLFSSIRFLNENGPEEWEFKEMPTKYKEFVDSVIKFDERADQVILSGKGIDASISNISKDGIISKSGSDVLYNYLIYINSLGIPEYICTYDINLAIRLNFPKEAAEGIKLGFYQHAPAKQEETKPSERLTQTATK